MKRYELEYRGAQLRLEINDKMISSLFVNGIKRDSDSSSLSGYCSLSTTIQTDYEWHEFIKAEVTASESEVIVKLSANSKIIGTEAFSLKTES